MRCKKHKIDFEPFTTCPKCLHDEPQACDDYASIGPIMDAAADIASGLADIFSDAGGSIDTPSSFDGGGGDFGGGGASGEW